HRACGAHDGCDCAPWRLNAGQGYNCAMPTPAVAPTALTASELQRYSRHLLIPEVGLAGQQKLRAAAVLLIGAGGLGSPAAMYLAAAGVGRIGLVDDDRVDASNLQRQVIHGTAQLGTLKVESARQRILDINPTVQVDVYNEL